MSHTPEPWRFQKYKSTSIIVDCAQPDHIIGDVHSDENARRIVACVNACEGIDTDTLEGEFKHLGAEYVEVVGLLEFSDKSLSSAKGERDTYRDLCAELIEKMREIKMIVNSPLEAYYIASDSITKAESILGEKQ